MAIATGRIEKVTVGLTPKQIVLLKTRERLERFASLEEWLTSTGGHNRDPLFAPVGEKVEASIRAAMKGQPRNRVDLAIRQGLSDAFFLLELFKQTELALRKSAQVNALRALLVLERANHLRDLNALRHELVHRIGSKHEGHLFIPDRLRRSFYGCLFFGDQTAREKVDEWRMRVRGCLTTMYVDRAAIDWIRGRYYDGQPFVFPETLADVDGQIRLMEDIVALFNDMLDDDLLTSSGSPLSTCAKPAVNASLKTSSFMIDTQEIKATMQPVVVHRVEELVMLSRAEILRWMGDDGAADALVESFFVGDGPMAAEGRGATP